MVDERAWRNYIKILAQEYIKRSEYPFMIGAAYDIPMDECFRRFNSKEELFLILRSYCHMLNIVSIAVIIDDKIIEIDFRGDNNGAN